jgi:hypothetical protein
MDKKAEIAARIAFASATAFLVILGALHGLDPALNVGHLISEYQRGRHGWLMSFAFLSLGVSSVALSVAIRSFVSTTVGRLAARWLAAIGVAYVGAGVFPPDSAAGFVARSDLAPSVPGAIHGVCGLIIIVTSPVAFTLVSRSIGQGCGTTLAPAVLKAAYAPWLGLVSFAVSLIIFGATDPHARGWEVVSVLVSVSNRVLIVTYCACLMLMSIGVLRAQPTSNGR